MHQLPRMRIALLTGLVALAVTVLAPSLALAKPEAGAPRARGFRLFARSLGALTVNRVYCGLDANGNI